MDAPRLFGRLDDHVTARVNVDQTGLFWRLHDPFVAPLKTFQEFKLTTSRHRLRFGCHLIHARDQGNESPLGYRLGALLRDRAW